MMTDFWSTVRELQKFWAYIATAAALPLFASFVELTPPWPSSISILTSIVNLLAVVICYQIFRAGSRRLISRVILLSAILLFLFSLVYLGLISEFTVKVPGGGVNEIKGFVCTEMAATMHEKLCPWLGEAELKDAEWTPTLLWTSWSVTIMRLLIVVSWLSSFMLLSICLATFIIYQRQRPGSARKMA